MKKKTCDKLVDGILYYWGECVCVDKTMDIITNYAFENTVKHFNVPYNADLRSTAYGLTNSQKRVLLGIMQDIYDRYAK